MQQVQVLDALDLGRVEVRNGRLDRLANRHDAAGPDFLRAAFRNQKRTLPLSAPIDHHQHPTAFDASLQRHSARIGLRDVEPEHIDRHCERFERKNFANEGISAVGRDGETGAKLTPIGQSNAGDGAIFFQIGFDR